MWRKIQKTLATVVPIVLLLVYLTMVVCLLNRWDGMVALTLVPLWAWTGAGALISLICWVVCRGVAPGVMFCLFLITGVGFSEEAAGIVRELFASVQKKNETPPDEARILRIVTVNCAGSEAALRTAAESKPDVLVVQEAPDKAVLEAVADQLYGVERSVSTMGTGAIIGRGETLGLLGGSTGQAIHVRLKRPDGFILDITNLDLKGCAPSLGMWHPEVWGQLVTARVETRRLVRASLGENPINRDKVGRIVCGGFGTPPGDDVFRPLENSGMVDTFGKAGQGWGNTYPSDFPLLRLDQVWVSPNLKPLKTTTRLNTSSAHRIVVSEVLMPLP